ncbi:MAG: ATP-binding cassette domain-containing protein [Verrucomicrobia bacterium]|jgi:manganese/zinc/iron transport system ATP- binding protein|nr:ATP-binding cassette domain-containing protein [Verrucomicrobiota bacterium]
MEEAWRDESGKRLPGHGAPGQARPHKDRPAPPLSVHDLTVAYHRKPVIWDVELAIPEGKLVAVVGPNGAGKSTLLKACLDLIPVTSGLVRVYGEPYRKNRHLVSYVPQRESVDWDFPVTVEEVVTMGTYGRLGWLRPVSRDSRERAREALRQVKLEDFAKRQISQLSGGQQQRTFLARALAQDAFVYLMDEPFAAVDASTERAIVDLLHNLKEDGKTCVVVHHDLSTVPSYFDHVILLNMRVVAIGPTKEVFTEENLRKTYGGQLTLLTEAANALRQTVR